MTKWMQLSIAPLAGSLCSVTWSAEIPDHDQRSRLLRRRRKVHVWTSAFGACRGISSNSTERIGLGKCAREHRAT